MGNVSPFVIMVIFTQVYCSALRQTRNACIDMQVWSVLRHILCIPCPPGTCGRWRHTVASLQGRDRQCGWSGGSTADGTATGPRLHFCGVVSDQLILKHPNIVHRLLIFGATQRPYHAVLTCTGNKQTRGRGRTGAQRGRVARRPARRCGPAPHHPRGRGPIHLPVRTKHGENV